MTEYIHLVGAEQVQQAANGMREAADNMKQAASSLDSSLQQHRDFLNDWLYRFKEIMKGHGKP